MDNFIDSITPFIFINIYKRKRKNPIIKMYKKTFIEVPSKTFQI